MKRHFEVSLDQLKAQLMTMAGLVEQAIESATRALQERDLSRIQEVYEIEKRVNQSHIRVDEACLNFLALQQPLANDLRLTIAVIKINTDLERMSDQAVNIAHHTELYLKLAPFPSLLDLPEMFIQVKQMVVGALDSFIHTHESLAREVLRRDDQVDRLKHKTFREVLQLLRREPQEMEKGLALILISRNLERIGDHATNIAEDVIFAITGEDVRHSAPIESIKEIFP
jgi:phosphate transport system protein